MAGVVVIGNLSKDVVDGGPPRTGGATFHAARALRLLSGRARIVTRCAPADRRTLLPPLVALGVPVTWLPAEQTAGFSFSYDGDVRTMAVDTLGDTWTPADAVHAGRSDWVHAGALARSDFPPETLAAFARGRRIALDGQGLVRPARTGPLELEPPPDLAAVGHVTVLKLSEEEAVAFAGEDYVPALRELDVPELLVTYGAGGSLLITRVVEERIPARRLPPTIDPTGAGDMFIASYLVSRSAGHRPLSAARHATTVVARVLGG